MIGVRGSGLRHIFNSHITMNTLYIILKGIVADILKTTSTSYIITPTINYYTLCKIYTLRSNRYTKRSTMVTWVMGGRVSGMGPIFRSTLTINSFYMIWRGWVSGIFVPRSISTIMNTYITPLVTMITTYISPPIAIIATDITPINAITNISYFIIAVHILVNRKIGNWWTHQYTKSPWVTRGIVSGLVLSLWCNNTTSFRFSQRSTNGLRSKISQFPPSSTIMSPSIIQ